jgi:hypothetical protein
MRNGYRLPLKCQKEKKINMIGDEKVNNKLNEDLSTQFFNLKNSRIISGTFISVGDAVHNT